MPFCRCGEICLEDKCKKCGFNFKSSPAVDRWQSRYMGSVMGLDSLASPEDDHDEDDEDDDNDINSRLACSPFTQRTSTPILKRISQTYNNLLDSRKVAPSQIKRTPVLIPSSRFSTESNCQECYKKLNGKTVRLPDTEIRYHWKCLKCKGCSLPFEDTSFFIDVHKSVFHPTCAPSTMVTQTCSRCSQTIHKSYFALNSTVLHPRCFRCTGCQKILQPASIYTDLDGTFCQHCTKEKLTDDKEILSKHMKIVPQPQTTPTFSTSPSVEKKLLSPLSNQSMSQRNGSIRPSTLMSSRGRPLPRFGVVRDCPGCNQRIVSVHEEIPGPKAARWHKKCLACDGCSKILDSGATVAEDLETGNLKPWCTTCLLTKKKKLSSSLSQKWNSTIKTSITRV